MRKCKFLLVEDDEVDVMTIRRAFDKVKIANPLLVASDGIEALDFLRGLNGKEKIRWPYIVLLDLNMPRMSGLEFLEEIRDDHKLKKSPVVVLTSSADDQDILSAYDKQVAGYIQKPVSSVNFLEKMSAIGKYWALCEM